MKLRDRSTTEIIERHGFLRPVTCDNGWRVDRSVDLNEGIEVKVDWNNVSIMLIVATLLLFLLSALLAPSPSGETWRPTTLLECNQVDMDKFLCKIKDI